MLNFYCSLRTKNFLSPKDEWLFVFTRRNVGQVNIRLKAYSRMSIAHQQSTFKFHNHAKVCLFILHLKVNWSMKEFRVIQFFNRLFVAGFGLLSICILIFVVRVHRQSDLTGHWLETTSMPSAFSRKVLALDTTLDPSPTLTQTVPLLPKNWRCVSS